MVRVQRIRLVRIFDLHCCGRNKCCPPLLGARKASTQTRRGRLRPLWQRQRNVPRVRIDGLKRLTSFRTTAICRCIATDSEGAPQAPLQLFSVSLGDRRSRIERRMALHAPDGKDEIPHRKMPAFTINPTTLHWPTLQLPELLAPAEPACLRMNLGALVHGLWLLLHSLLNRQYRAVAPQRFANRKLGSAIESGTQFLRRHWFATIAIPCFPHTPLSPYPPSPRAPRILPRPSFSAASAFPPDHRGSGSSPPRRISPCCERRRSRA